MKTYEILGQKYPVTGYITVPRIGTLPLVNIPMMSDERWEELTRENAVRNYTQVFGHAPESVAVAIEWQRAEACGRRDRHEAQVV